jgi:hypothetical protein
MPGLVPRKGNLMSLKLRSLFASMLAVMGMRSVKPAMPMVTRPADNITGSFKSGGSIRRPASRATARANARKAARYAKRSTKRARGHASRHA